MNTQNRFNDSTLQRARLLELALKLTGQDHPLNPAAGPCADSRGQLDKIVGEVEADAAAVAAGSPPIAMTGNGAAEKPALTASNPVKSAQSQSNPVKPH